MSIEDSEERQEHRIAGLAKVFRDRREHFRSTHEYRQEQIRRRQLRRYSSDYSEFTRLLGIPQEFV